MKVNLNGPIPALTPSIVEEVRKIAPTLPYQKAIAETLGFHERTFNGWMQHGKAAERKQMAGEPLDSKEQLYLSLLVATRAGRADFRQEAVNSVRSAYTGKDRDWRAASWALEKVFPDEFGAKADDIKAALCELKALRAEMAAMRAEQAATLPPPPAHPQTPPIMLHDVLPDAVVKEDE